MSQHTESAPLIDCRRLSHAYTRGGETLVVLSDLDLQVLPGEFIALMGPSGSGKSTLLNLLGGLEKPNPGQLFAQSVDLADLSIAELTRWRASTVGFIFQFYNLMPALTALENVQLPLLLTKLGRAERLQQARLALDIVDLAGRAEHKPAELSGGQQQRVAIARALVSDPQLLVCDEPTGDLDRASADATLALLQTLNEQHGKTIVMVTHDPQAAAYAGRVLTMDKGRLMRAAA